MGRIEKILMSLAIISGLLLVTPSNALAKSCNIKTMPFGDSIKDVVKKYKLMVTAINPEGNMEILGHSQVFCDDLPYSSFAEFIFRDNKLVKVITKVVEGKGLLYQTALKRIGDDVTLPTKRGSKVTDENDLPPQARWKDDKLNIVYSAFTSGDEEVEMLVVSAKKYSDIMAEHSMEQEEAE